MYIYADIMNRYAGYNFVANATLYMQFDEVFVANATFLCANGHKSTLISRKICYNSVIHLNSFLE